MGFDIEGLLDFEPASARCAKCLALVPGVKSSEDYYDCPVCDIKATRSNVYLTTTTSAVSTTASQMLAFSGSSLIQLGYGYGYGYQSGRGYELPNFLLPVAFNKDAMDHAKELAGFARLLRSVEGQPPLRVLVSCLLRARAFVHFTTFGISQAILGALAAVSEFAPVSGIVSNVDSGTIKEIEQLCKDFTHLDIRAVPRSSGDEDLIHSKLIVIDGLLALGGSANLTTGAWRKAAANKERLDIVTDVQRVTQDNNRYFATHWAEFQRDVDVSQFSWQGWQVYRSGSKEVREANDEER
jgi:hypothetical protein